MKDALLAMSEMNAIDEQLQDQWRRAGLGPFVNTALSVEQLATRDQEWLAERREMAMQAIRKVREASEALERLVNKRIGR
jgi:hypothetical protein